MNAQAIAIYCCAVVVTYWLDGQTHDSAKDPRFFRMMIAVIWPMCLIIVAGEVIASIWNFLTERK